MHTRYNRLIVDDRHRTLLREAAAERLAAGARRRPADWPADPRGGIGGRVERTRRLDGPRRLEGVRRAVSRLAALG